jgi:hypothetical protein
MHRQKKDEGGLKGRLSMMDYTSPWLLNHYTKKNNVSNKRFTFDDNNTTYQMGFIANKGHTHDEGLLRFNPNL